MKITPIKNSRGVAGGCIDTILGTAVCPMCGSSSPVEVASPSDQKESAWFIYHEKLGGGYCPGSEINAIKLEKMAGLISEIKKLGFIVADIINRDPTGEAQKIIAHLPGKACLLQVDCQKGEFVWAAIEGQLKPWTLVYSMDFMNQWTDLPFIQMACNSTKIKEEDLCIAEQGKFLWGTFIGVPQDKWLMVVRQFLDCHRDDLAKKFTTSFLILYFARQCPCNLSSFSKETASAINRSVADKFPAEMFSADTELITEVR